MTEFVWSVDVAVQHLSFAFAEYPTAGAVA